MTDHEASRSTAEIHEPIEATAPTEPVSRTGRAPAAGRARWRWLVALVVVALVTTATIAGGVLLTGARSPSAVARWAPVDALAYAELRPDLPGDQRDQLAAFLSAFPGFADRSNLERKLTEVYDELLSTATKGKQTYSADIAPWFGGQLGVALRAPAVPSSTTRTPPPTLLVAASTDPAKALAWFRASAIQKGATVATVGSGGAPLLTATMAGETIAATAPAGVLLVGDEPMVRAAVARGGSGGLATDADFQAAMTALPADGLATAYLHVAAYVDLIARLPRPSSMPSPPADLASLLPAWSAVTVRAGTDALTADSAAPSTSLTSAVPDGQSELPARLPASTIALVDVHDLGRAVTAGLSASGQAQQGEIAQMLTRVGGLKGLVGWAGEAAAVVIRSGERSLPGAVALATDPAGAEALGASLSNLATLAGVTPAVQTYAGHTITTVDLSRFAAEAGRAGASGSGGTPAEAGAVSWTIADDLVAVGADPAFVKAVLDTKPGASLADAARFTSMVGRVPSSNHALVWVDLAAVRDAAAARIPSADRTRYQTDIAPYLAPLSGLVGAATHDGSLERGHGLLILERP